MNVMLAVLSERSGNVVPERHIFDLNATVASMSRRQGRLCRDAQLPWRSLNLKEVFSRNRDRWNGLLSVGHSFPCSLDQLPESATYLPSLVVQSRSRWRRSLRLRAFIAGVPLLIAWCKSSITAGRLPGSSIVKSTGP